VPKIAPSDRETNGPFDVSEIGLLTPYLDFESIRIAPKPGLVVRADIDEVNNRVVAITLEEDGLRLQLQAFAASKIDGMWEPTLSAIEQAVAEQGGSAQRVDGALGPEIKAGILKPLRVKDLVMSRRFYLIKDRRRTASPLCKAFVDFLLASSKPPELPKPIR
jgi:DNA-binding transcriptional LysR family regulator